MVHDVRLDAGNLRVCTSVEIVNESVLERTENFLVVAESLPINDLIIDGLSLAPSITEVCINNDDCKFIQTRPFTDT